MRNWLRDLHSSRNYQPHGAVVGGDMLTKSKNGRFISTPEDLFEKHVLKGDGCWLWNGYRNQSGYGVTRVGGRGSKAIFAHRLSWEIHKGPIPDGLHVLHRCDNPQCVNPEHLFLGTDLDNQRDRIAKGRPGGGCFKAGDRSPVVKHSDAKISLMRAERAAWKRVIDISREYGIQRDYLSRILNGKERVKNC